MHFAVCSNPFGTYDNTKLIDLLIDKGFSLDI